MTYEMIEKANGEIKKTNIKGKEYAEVNQRITAFRKCLPNGFIHTYMVSNENGVCVFRAECGEYSEDGREIVYGSGTAYEKENSTFINNTSYIENCETSAVGRALGMCGFGIDTSVASAEEVANAINNQGYKNDEKKPTATPEQVKILEQYYKDENLAKLLKANGINAISELPLTKASALIKAIRAKEKKDDE